MRLNQPSSATPTRLLCATDAMASDYINVVLMSGRAAQVPVIMDQPLKRVKLETQSGLRTGMGVLRDSKGGILDDCQTASAAGLKSGDTLTLQVRQTRVASHKLGMAFAALKGDGSVVTWGDPDYGGDSTRVLEQLKNVQHIQATCNAFAAVLGNGSVVAWGRPTFGGESSRAQEQLKNVQHIQATETAFAAVLDSGSVVTWGDLKHGGDSSRVQEQLKNVQHIQATRNAFAAVLDNGSVVTWGDPRYGGDSSRVQEQLKNVAAHPGNSNCICCCSGTTDLWSPAGVTRDIWW